MIVCGGFCDPLPILFFNKILDFMLNNILLQNVIYVEIINTFFVLFKKSLFYVCCNVFRFETTLSLNRYYPNMLYAIAFLHTQT